jgi:hypothetical protein
MSMPALLQAQPTNEAQLTRWLEQLDHDVLPVRDQAEASLLESGPATAAWLEQAAGQQTLSAEAAFRVQRIREQLFAQQVQAAAAASTVSLDGQWNGTAIMENLARQTGNRVLLPVDSRIGVQQVVREKFWTVVERICRQNGLVIDHAASGDQQLVLKRATEPGEPASPRAMHTGLLRVEWLADEDLEEDQQIRLRFLWEPRLRVQSLQIPMAGVQLLDSRGQPWGRFNRDAVYTIPAPANRHDVALRLPVKATSGENLRQVVLPVQLDVIAPSARCVFPDVLAAGWGSGSCQFGMASILLESVESANDQLSVRLQTRYRSESMARPLQSHEEWSRFCTAELVNPDGQRIQPVGERQVRQEPWSYVIEYNFERPRAEVPWQLVFFIPSGLMRVQEQVVWTLPD